MIVRVRVSLIVRVCVRVCVRVFLSRGFCDCAYLRLFACVRECAFVCARLRLCVFVCV